MDMTEDQEANLMQLVETLRQEVDSLLAERNEARDVSQLREQASELAGKLDGLSDRLATVETDADNEGDDGDDINEQEPMPFEDDENQQVVQPDSVEWKGDELRKSIAWAPDGTNVAQLNEFDDAPSVGCIKVVARGGKLLLVDPDRNTGMRKWMVPLRRDDTTKELKWALLGDDSDSDSDSDSDIPYIPEPPPPYPPGYEPPDPPNPDDSDSDEPPQNIYIVIPNPNYNPTDPDSNPWELYDIAGFFWLRGGSAVTNYGTSLKLGSANVGYITIRAV